MKTRGSLCFTKPNSQEDRRVFGNLSFREMTYELLDWFRINHRILPWRVLSPGHADPYLVWLSETMLQQTTVATVLPYFERFRTELSSVEAVAAASEDHILSLWSGLGYYSRARRFREAAQQLVQGIWHQHEIKTCPSFWPTTPNEWQRLSGVGPYTAAAICSMAFHAPVVPIDGNIRRIFMRLIGTEVRSRDSDQQVHALAQIWPHKVSSPVPWGDFAQGLMDLGALICRPQRPLCETCPWKRRCLSAGKISAHSTLQTTKIRPRPQRRSFALYLTNEKGEVYFEKETSKLLQGLLTVPFISVTSEPLPIPTFRHAFSHFDWWVTVVHVPVTGRPTVLDKPELPSEWRESLLPHGANFFPLGLSGKWIPCTQLENYPLSALVKKIIKIR